MHLSPTQKEALKTAVQASPDTNQLYVDGNLSGLCDLLNTTDSPAFIVWRPSVAEEEILRADGFDYARVDNLSVGKARIWEWMFRPGPINPSKANIRDGIEKTWVGTAADLAVRAVVLVVCKRSATRFEKIFSTGAGSDASPAVLGVDVQGEALVSPVLPSELIGL